MTFKKIFLLLTVLFPFFAVEGAPQSDQDEILIQNRVLANVNNKAITVMDVVKKMDLFLAKAYPEYAKSNAARAQFFQQSWKQTLNQMIDHELILADAEKMEMKVTDGDIREEIHARFGPNVMSHLDALGLTYDEAWQMVYAEIAVQRMSWYRVHSKAMQKIGPQDVKKAFAEWSKHNPPKENWKYQVLSIRSKTEKIGQVFAQKAFALIHNEPLPFQDLAKQLIEKNDPDVTISLSEEYDVDNKDLSESHKAILTSLQTGTYSEPTPQVSRVDKSIVHRIFYLKDHTKEAPVKFDEKMEELQDDLLQKESSAAYPEYISKLRRQFNFDGKQLEELPDQFQTFILN